MKILICCICLLFSCNAISQELTGEWQGYYTYDFAVNNKVPKTSIALNIVLNTDGTYNIFSYTKLKKAGGEDTIKICKVKYRKTGKHSIQLVEEKYNAGEVNSEISFQKMFLKPRHKNGTDELYGRWESVDGNNLGKGEIFFKRSK